MRPMGITAKTRSLVSRMVGSTLILRENAETPSDEEWEELLGLLVRHGSEIPGLKILIVTDGGGPSTEQRKRLESTMRARSIDRKSIRVAVVSDSMKVRFVASTIALFHQHHRSFGLDELRDACEHLKMTPTERSRVEKELKEMKAQIS